MLCIGMLKYCYEVDVWYTHGDFFFVLNSGCWWAIGNWFILLYENGNFQIKINDLKVTYAGVEPVDGLRGEENFTIFTFSSSFV